MELDSYWNWFIIMKKVVSIDIIAKQGKQMWPKEEEMKFKLDEQTNEWAKKIMTKKLYFTECGTKTTQCETICCMKASIGFHQNGSFGSNAFDASLFVS